MSAIPEGTMDHLSQNTGAVPTVTDDVIKLQEKIMKQSGKCVSNKLTSNPPCRMILTSK